MNDRPIPCRTRHRQSRARGFTLIELLLVMVILAILAAVIVPSFTSRSKQARETRAIQDIANPQDRCSGV